MYIVKFPVFPTKYYMCVNSREQVTTTAIENGFQP